MLVTIKGLNKNLVFIFSPGTISEYINFLSERLKQSPQLFRGSKVFFQGPGLDLLSQEEIAELQMLCLENGILLHNMSYPANKSPERQTHMSQPEAQPYMMYYRSIRSGQRITAEGPIVIWGDVHESAEISAGGDIIILGRLGGIAHAGCYGDLNSFVFALDLCPTQIRIANHISRAAEEPGKRPYPEIAYWDGGNICIAAYDSKDLPIIR